MGSRPVRLGLVGAGRWGRAYIRTIASLQDVTLDWLASSNEDARKLVGTKCHITRNWKDLAHATSLDGVIVATPPEFHIEITKFAVNSGLGVLVEKPLALSVKEAEEVLNLAEQKNVQVMVDHINLFNPAYRRLKDLAASAGPVKQIHSISGNWGPFRRDTAVLWDWGPHDVSMCLDILGQIPASVEAKRIRQTNVNGLLGELVFFRLFFDGNARSRTLIGNILKKKRRMLDVQLSDKVMIFDDLSEDKLKILSRSPESPTRMESVETLPALPLTTAVLEFSEALQKGRADLKNLMMGVEVTRVLSRLEASLLKHKSASGRTIADE